MFLMLLACDRCPTSTPLLGLQLPYISHLKKLYKLFTEAKYITHEQSNKVIKDEAYWERRRKNNDAAKRSRDQRRLKVLRVSLKSV